MLKKITASDRLENILHNTPLPVGEDRFLFCGGNMDYSCNNPGHAERMAGHAARVAAHKKCWQDQVDRRCSDCMYLLERFRPNEDNEWTPERVVRTIKWRLRHKRTLSAANVPVGLYKQGVRLFGTWEAAALAAGHVLRPARGGYKRKNGGNTIKQPVGAGTEA